jgi:hypothetical protein
VKHFHRGIAPMLVSILACTASDVVTASSEATLTAALTTALDDYGVIPLYNPLVSWAAAKTVAYTPRIDDLTLPHHVTKR